MKKYLLGWMTIFMMAVACVVFTSCGSDDDGGGGDSNMVGVWKRVYKKTTTYQLNSSGQWVQVGQPEEKSYEGIESDGIQFLPDGRAVEVDINADGTVRDDDEYFNYKIENGKLYLLELDHPEDGWEEVGPINISGNQFELTEEDVYSDTKRVKIKRYRKIS